MAIDRIEEISNYLLNNCFLLGTEDSMREQYFYVLNHEFEFKDVLSRIGYVLNINRGLKVIQAVNTHGIGKVEFRKYESIILLILRMLYMEKRESLSSNADKVYVTVCEINTEYSKLNLPKKLDQVLVECVRKIKKYNLASPIGNLDNESSKIQVYPSIMLAIPDNKITEQYESVKDLINQYDSAGSDEQ